MLNDEFTVVAMFTIDFETAFSLRYALRPKKIFITSNVCCVFSVSYKLGLKKQLSSI
jgi:hypothetical protein